MREASTVLAPPPSERSVDASRHHRTGFVGRPVGGLPVLFHHDRGRDRPCGRGCAVRKLGAPARSGCGEPRRPAATLVRVIVSLMYQVARTLLAVPAVLLRRDTAREAELLVLRHENAV